VRYLLAIFLLLSVSGLEAQDSLARVSDLLRKDSLRLDSIAKDSIAKKRIFQVDTMIYAGHPFYKFTDPVRFPSSKRAWHGKEWMFYSIIALLLFFAFIRNAFYKYLQDLLRTFFRTSIKQRQIKDQLMQSPLPSLLLNIFFILCTALYICIILQYFGLGGKFDFWELYAYCLIGLIVIYTLKFLSLKLLGWVFQVSESTDAYIFIVFTTNKILGITLLPFVMVLAFTEGAIYQGTLTLSVVLIAACIIYRYFLAYSTIHRTLKMNFLHFFLYFMAFELVPLLLINKLLFQFLT
jgi:hypothetical protein